MNHTSTPLDDIMITGSNVPYDPYGTIQSLHSHPILGVNSFSLDETVRGEMITVQKVIDVHESQLMKLNEDEFNRQVKRELTIQLAEHILKNNFVEFTKQQNMNTSEVTYRARAYLTPDDRVRMLRKVSP
jgi:hypothetical protein